MAAETLQRRTPMGPLADELRRVCSGERFTCHEDAFRTLTEIRCGNGAEPAAAEAVGAELPAIGTATRVGDTFVIGLGPGWWMVDGPDGSSVPTGSRRVSSVDVSAQRTPLVLAGTSVPDVLAHGTSLDLHQSYFATGAAAQTLLAKAGVMLARTGSAEYRVWVRASFARYLALWLIDASIEYR